MRSLCANITFDIKSRHMSADAFYTCLHVPVLGEHLLHLHLPGLGVPQLAGHDLTETLLAADMWAMFDNVWSEFTTMVIRAGWPPKPLSATLDNQLPSMSGAHGLKDFLCNAHLLESFEWRIYTYGSVLKSKLVTQRTQEDGYYRENPSNHELLTLRGVDRRG